MSDTQTAVPVGIRLMVDDEEHAKFQDKSELDASDIITVINEANGLIENDYKVSIIIRFRMPNGNYNKAQLVLNSVVEPHEALSFGQGTPPAISKWVDDNNFDAPPEEPQCQTGESFVHLTINDERKGVIGRVTAMLRLGTDEAYEVSFAFCNKADDFSRRKGRRISRERMEKGETCMIRKFSSYSRFDTIKTTIQELMSNGETCMLLENSGENVSYPKWLSPEAHPDVPEPVQGVLRKVAFGGKLEGSDRGIAMEYLGLSGEHQTKFVMHEDEVNTFDQKVMTFEVES